MLGETPCRLKQHPFTTLLYILRAELLNIPYAVLEGVGVSWRKAAENESIRILLSLYRQCVLCFTC